MGVSITFLGGAGTVTGSRYLVRQGDQRLLVDCGLFQGYKLLRLRNWSDMGVNPGDIQAVVLTHAHLDHSGYLPLLVRNGFRGKVFATRGTRDLCGILLPDSGHIQEEDAAFANRHGFSRHVPAMPLYTRQDALDCLPRIRAVTMGQQFQPLPGWSARFSEAGHILGAASLLLEVGNRRILFSGDLGRPDDLIMNPPAYAPQADTVVIESTYGNRLHPDANLLDELASPLKRLSHRQGVAVIPVFAVGRAQALLHAIHLLKQRGDLPTSLPVFLDSPMAVHTTHLFEHHLGEHRLSRQDSLALTRQATMISTTEDSRALMHHRGPMVILSASGMATGGRVLHHMEHHAGDARNMILLTGYQAPGTRGAALAAGAGAVRIHGHEVEVRAEVVQLQSASAHADAAQLVTWLRTMPAPPEQIYVVHGEPSAAQALSERIAQELGWRTRVPEHNATWPA